MSLESQLYIGPFTGEYRFLSNFFPVDPSTLFGYPTVEHYYQAQKTRDYKQSTAIKNAKTPGQAKRMGKKVDIRDDWEQIKQRVMFDGVLLKFMFNHDLGDMLIATGDRDIVEINTWGDRYWGICEGTGENHLGKILMQVRQVVATVRADNPRSYDKMKNHQMEVQY